MDYREELARRLERVPFSARQIAGLAGVSPAWVAKAKKREAHKITLETAQRINAAIDKLAEQAQGKPAHDPTVHPGIEALVAAPALAQAAGLDAEFLRTHRHLYLPGPEGKPIIIETVEDALDLLRPLQRAWRRLAERE